MYIREHLFDLFEKLSGYFNYSSTKILYIDTKRYPIYQQVTVDNFSSDIVNALIAGFILLPENKIKSINWIFIFRTEEADYKFDTSKWSKRDVEKLRNMLKKIGKTPTFEAPESIDDQEVDTAVDDSIDNLTADLIDDETEIDDDIDTQTDDSDLDESNKQTDVPDSTKTNVMQSLSDQINSLNDKYNVNQQNEKPDDDKKQQTTDSIYNANALKVHTDLTHRINPNMGVNVVNQYKHIKRLIEVPDDSPVEKGILDNVAKNVSDTNTAVNDANVLNTVSSPREQEMRLAMEKLKVNDISFKTLSSVVDVPMDEPVRVNNTTTTNSGAMKGSGFPHVSKAYEDKLMDADIVSIFMNLSNLPNGFYVTNVEVTDISNCTSLLNNWRVTLKNKRTEKNHVVNVRVPKVVNGTFYNNGIRYNIGKQDFPIPILKINKKTVIITSNYNKITVDRYDTRSLADINVLVKVLKKAVDENGENKYVKPGSSINTNSKFVSTIEYDEFAKFWHSFSNVESECVILFNRQNCLKEYNFVSVNKDEFCCGMIKGVPIILNTTTGLTRKGLTLTDTIVSCLPMDLQSTYRSTKPGKTSMYSQITIGNKVPLGVAIAAWEGISTLLRKSGVKYMFVNPRAFKDPKYFVIPFKDKGIAILNTTANQLIFNGFYRINTKAYNLSDFELPIMNSNSVYVDIFNQLFFTQYTQLTPFITYHDFFVDPITKDVCLHYNIPDDIAGMLIYASNMLADNNFVSENNSSLYRLRTTEIIPAIIHYHLAVAISRFNNSSGSKSTSNVLHFNPNEVLLELTKVPNVETLSALNPFVELHTRENVTKKGFRGVNDDRAYSLDKRSYDESMIGKMAISSPNNATVGITRQLVVDPKIESVRGYTSIDDVTTDFNDLQLASFSELLTPGTVTRDDAIRTAIATSQTSHIVATEAGEPVLVSNGLDEIVPSYLTDEFSVVAEEDGQVIDIADGYMVVRYKSGKKKAINVNNRYSFNTGSGFYVDNKLIPNLKVYAMFKKGDILAYHEKFFTKDSEGVVRLNIGPIAKVAFTGVYSTYEDAGLITHKMSKKLGTKLSMMQSIKLNGTDDIEKIVKVGDEVEVSDPLVVFGLGDTGDKNVDNFLKAFRVANDEKTMLDTAKRVIKSKHAGKVVDVRMYTTKPLDKLSPSLYDIFDNYFKENIRKRKTLDKHDKSDSVYKMDTLYTLPTEPLKGGTVKGQTCDILIEIFIEHEDEASVGDKIVAYGASKQVLSEVVPEGLEPYTESKPDEEISVFVAPSAILKRMIPSLTITASANKVLIELKNQIKEIWES